MLQSHLWKNELLLVNITDETELVMHIQKKRRKKEKDFLSQCSEHSNMALVTIQDYYQFLHPDVHLLKHHDNQRQMDFAKVKQMTMSTM